MLISKILSMTVHSDLETHKSGIPYLVLKHITALRDDYIRAVRIRKLAEAISK